MKIKESFTAKGLKEAEEKLGIMKLPEEERKAYEHYKDDLHYQASMFESFYGDGYHTGREETTRTIALKLIQQGAEIEIINAVTGLSVAAIEELVKSVQ